MLKNYRENDPEAFKVLLFDLISQKNYAAASDLAKAIKTEGFDMELLSSVLVTRQVHGTFNGEKYTFADDYTSQDNSNSEKSEEEEEDSEQYKILPLFAALE